MNRRRCAVPVLGLAVCLLVVAAGGGFAQPPGGKGGPGGFGPPGGGERKIVKDFDKNGDGWLNQEERAVARESLKKGGGA